MRTTLPVSLLAAALLLPGSGYASDDVELHEVLFRSMATGAAANDTQRARCAEHIAGRTYAARGTDLDYRVYGMGIAEGSGLVVEHQREDLGPGFMCTMLPDATSPDVARAYAYFELPAFGEIEIEGPCRPNATVNSGETFWHCRLDVLPNPAAGIVGGSIATNSVLVLGNATTQFRTGSIWIGYIATSGIEVPSPAATFAPTPASDPFGGAGGSMLAFRDGAPVADGAACPPAIGRTDRVVHAAASDPGTGLLDPRHDGPVIGLVIECSEGPAFSVLLELFDGAGSQLVTAAGSCEQHATPLGGDTRFRACRAQIAPSPADGILGGSLVQAGLTGRPDARGSWTMFLVRA